MLRVTIEVVQRASKSAQVRAVLTDSGRPERNSHTDSVRVALPEGTRLDESAIWELRQAVEQEIKGWQSRLPLDY